MAVLGFATPSPSSAAELPSLSVALQVASTPEDANKQRRVRCATTAVEVADDDLERAFAMYNAALAVEDDRGLAAARPWYAEFDREARRLKKGELRPADLRRLDDALASLPRGRVRARRLASAPADPAEVIACLRSALEEGRGSGVLDRATWAWHLAVFAGNTDAETAAWAHGQFRAELVAAASAGSLTADAFSMLFRLAVAFGAHGTKTSKLGRRPFSGLARTPHLESLVPHRTFEAWRSHRPSSAPSSGKAKKLYVDFAGNAAIPWTGQLQCERSRNPAPPDARTPCGDTVSRNASGWCRG